MSQRAYRARIDLSDSGYEWLDDIPEYWKLSRIGAVFHERNDKVSDLEFPPISVTKSGIVPQLETAAKTDAGDNRKRVEPGDFVINSRSDRKGSSGVSGLRGSTSLISIVIRPTSVHQGYVHHLLRSYPFQEEFYRFGKGIVADLWSTKYSDMKNIQIPIPPENEQMAIASFLDYETSRIDTLIEKQKRLIELLKEKRQAVISQAVTRGLDPDVPLKDSGVEWLGEVPEHWVVTRMKFELNRIEQGKSPECHSHPAESNQWGVLKSGCVNGGLFRESENKALPNHLQPIDSIEVKVGDVLMSRASGSIDLIGSVALVKETRSKLMLSDKIFRLIIGPRMNKTFFTYQMSSLPLRIQIRDQISGAEGLANNITKTGIKNLFMCRPPLDEQSLIAERLAESSIQIDRALSMVEKMICLLQEKRSALISAAVTGKIDVRDWTPPEKAA